jgi:hypothetical protein
MVQEPNPPSSIEQVVARALRDNLERIQRTSDELHQAIADVVAACSSTKPTNALPHMLRAQTGAAALSASLDVLSRFVAVTLQPGLRSPLEGEIARIAGSVFMTAVPEVASAPAPVPAVPAQPAPGEVKSIPATPAPEAHSPAPAPRAVGQHHPPAPEPPMPESLEIEAPPPVLGEPESAEEQELHRRANRVAKVSMQDIKMLRPEQVRLGRQHKDLCIRLRDDIEKAHREYDRRFRPIMDHPVDYFYRWMVEILAEGDPHALGEYPYATTGTRH